MKRHRTSNCGVYAPEELPEDEHEETGLPEVDFGFASGNAKKGQMCNPIGFGKVQRVRFPLRIRYLADDKAVHLKLAVEIEGKEIPLRVDGNRKLTNIFVALLYEVLGDCVYEQ